ncbi:MAG: alpha/beta fold hydrolase [Oscillatoriophycideae cyanobacterium NC_groundwater_1537_Pr4_S-0.65um_50_18]|nr:alpha/beta fold hydrolase [Oscillatoriophycideae cyanobacterium NC_groundwater_1537_Pr4_S-0.65um_50_18]
MTSAIPSSLHTLVTPQSWRWRGFSIRYQAQGEAGAAVVLIHGFGASWGHWRKNIPALSEHFRVYAIDLIGFGGSDKPSPTEIAYTFETWGAQIADFCREVVGTPAFLVGNSIGAIVAMQAAVDAPESVRGVALLNCSLRLLHDRRRGALPWYRSLGTPILQNLLAQRWLGHGFFRLLANPKTVRKILLQAYGRDEAVTDELVALLMAPAADRGAADVFLAFTRYSQGPLPEDLLAVLPCPALMLWGTADPWEPIAQGKELGKFPCVQQFIPLEGIGHCPQDEAPELVNPILQDWMAKLDAETA